MTDATAPVPASRLSEGHRVHWRFASRDSFAELAHHHRMPLIHSLPGMLVWPLLLLFFGVFFAALGEVTWLLSGGGMAPFTVTTAQFTGVTVAYAVLATLMWNYFRRYDAHHRAFSILPTGPVDFLIAIAVMAFVLQIGSPLTVWIHEWAMLDPTLTISGGATREDVSNVDDFTNVGAARWSIILLTVVAAPIVEEILFRGWMLPMMMARGVPAFFAILISALAFGLIHTPQGLMVVISTFFLGIALGVARVVTGRVAAPVLGHMANNAWAVLVVPQLIALQSG